MKYSNMLIITNCYNNTIFDTYIKLIIKKNVLSLQMISCF